MTHLTIQEEPFIGIRYCDESGFYAVAYGRIIYDTSIGINGTLSAAWDNLKDYLDANRTPAENQPGWEFLPF